jgi:GNAT superfamily N-acetyltransferase
MVTCIRTTSDNTDFKGLVALLDADLRVRDGDEHAFYAQYNKTDAIKHVIVAYDRDVAVGCGAIKEYDAATMEVKRMYVTEDKRGYGIASAILKELEDWAAEMHYQKCVLETGKKQPEAIALYLKNNYSIIPNYGQYAGIENSVCFEKGL